MICDMSDVTMDGDFEEEKIQTTVAPTPSASHNPKDSTTGDGHGVEATKMSKMTEMAKEKNASDIIKMSEMAKDVKSASDFDNRTKLTGSLTSSIEKVAVTEISSKCDKMSNFPKVMGHNITAGSTHSVSDVRQINMAGNI